jgi:hypothetical protein
MCREIQRNPIFIRSTYIVQIFQNLHLLGQIRAIFNISATFLVYVQTKLCFLVYNSQFHTLLLIKTPAALRLDYPPYETDREVAALEGAVW